MPIFLKEIMAASDIIEEQGSETATFATEF